MNKLRFIFIFICCCNISAAPAKQVSQFNSPTVIENWISHYYQHPQPEKFIAMLSAASKLNMLQEEFRWSELTGFSAGIINTQPKIASQLEQLLEKLPANERQPLILGLLYANQPESRSALKTLARKISSYNSGITRSLSMRDTGLYKMLPLNNNPTAIDAYWGYFMANGSATSVKLIINTLNWLNTNNKTDSGTIRSNQLVAKVALASLHEHIQSSHRVREICRQQMHRQPRTTAILLQKMLSHKT